VVQGLALRGEIVKDKKISLMSADEHIELREIRDSQEKNKIPDRWLVNIAGILMIVTAILTFRYCHVFVTFTDTESSRYMFFWVAFQLVVGVPSIIGAIAAFSRRNFQYAMVGAVVGIIGTVVLGFLAIILLVIAQDEFD